VASLFKRVLHDSPTVTLTRVTCDGLDTPRAEVEPMRGDQVVIVLRGMFELRRGERAIVDPTRAFVLRDGAEHVFRHPCDGGDVCLAVSGAIAARIATTGPAVRALSPVAWSRLRQLAAGESDDVLAIEETLYDALTAADPPVRAGHRDRAHAEEIAYLLRRRLDGRVTLEELARATGYSEFHLCRAFRRATGMTIGAFHRDLRIRHALALILETRRPLAEIAIEVGFTSQAHLTTQLRQRVGVTPRRARKAGGL